MGKIDYSDPAKNPYANDPVAQEAIEFLFSKLRALNPNVDRNTIWEWYIQNRPLVDAENLRLKAEGKDLSHLNPIFNEFVQDLNGEKH